MTTIHQLHRATPAQCPPCNGDCHQGRHCNAEAASACSELLEDDEQTEHRFRAAARFWKLYGATLLVAACVAIAHYLPALSALLTR